MLFQFLFSVVQAGYRKAFKVQMYIYIYMTMKIFNIILSDIIKSSPMIFLMKYCMYIIDTLHYSLN
jgi:hypothetical protein